jgi:phosphate:Na+ symporter
MILPENLHSGACIPLHPPSYLFIIEMVHPRTGKQSFTLHAFYILWISDFTFKLYTHKQENIPSNKRVKQSEELQMTVFNVFSLLGGLALFLFGMDIMGKALEKQAGGQLQKILSKLTDNPLKGFFLGLCVTAVIQSSSATTVMVVGFVNSGIMELHQAIGVIMGSNVGTTVTSWILSLSGLQGDSFLINMLEPTSFSPVLAFIGILLYMGKSEKRRGVGTILIGFAVLMTGMTAMSNAVLPLQNEAWFTNLFIRFSNPLLGVLVGAVVTGIIQSSSASVGILQALSATGVITYGSAIPIIMGQNIGTCVTALISSVGANKNARRAAMVHLYFNIIGVTLFLAVFYGANLLLDFAFVTETVTAWGIAVVHSIFNLTATAVLLPFANGLEKLAILTIPDDAEKESFALLDERLLNTPAVAVERARAATADMAELARVGVVQAMSLTHKWDDSLAQKVREEEEKVDKYEDALGTYLVKLSSREMSHADSQSVNTLLHTISDFERISDHSVNVLSSAEEIHAKSIAFSKDAQEELQVLEGAVQDVLSRTTDAFRKGDLHMAGKVEPLETVVDELVRAIKARHVARLQTGSCSIEYGFVLEDLLTNYERVCDHCSNVAVAQIEVAQDSFDTHAYLNDLRYGNETKESEQFQRRLDRYRERYLFPDSDTAPADAKEEPNK